MVEDAATSRDRLRGAIDDRPEKSAQAQTDAGKELRDQVLKGVSDLGQATGTTLNQISEHQKERLDKVAAELARLVDQQDLKLGEIRTAVEGRLDKIRTENAEKLEEMRRTVDEKLQSTLDERLGASFNRVVEQLERVHKGIGEMQTLASGVGDLKKVLSNVTVRGALGEIQLSILLEQFLSPEQMIRNAAIREETQERVEFAVKLPGRDGENEVLLPIDAKFPQEDYQRLLAAAEQGDAEAAAAAGQALEGRIRLFAKSIREKYVHPPRTTDFAVLFLPTEGLYAEILRRPGLFEQLQRDHHVTLAGPTTLTALLNALQMRFRSLAIERRSSEVWQVLGAVRTEFTKYNDVVERIGKQLGTAATSVEQLGVRTRAMSRKPGKPDRRRHRPCGTRPVPAGNPRRVPGAHDTVQRMLGRPSQGAVLSLTLADVGAAARLEYQHRDMNQKLKHRRVYPVEQRERDHHEQIHDTPRARSPGRGCRSCSSTADDLA